MILQGSCDSYKRGLVNESEFLSKYIYISRIVESHDQETFSPLSLTLCLCVCLSALISASNTVDGLIFTSPLLREFREAP